MRSKGNRDKWRSGFATIPVFAAMLVTTNVWAQTPQPPDTWLRINAFTDIPLRNADVEVYDSAGRRIFYQSNATNLRGVFPAKIQNLPRDFRVIVSGEDGDPERKLGRLRLASDVRNFDPVRDIVYINAVTTIVSRVIDRFPGAKLPEEQAMVGRFLGLQANASLGAALRHGVRYRSRHFSHTVFLAEAVKQGGLEPLINSLVTEMIANPGTTHKFPPPPQTASDTAKVAGAAPQAESDAPPALLGSALSFVAENLAKGALSWAAGQGMGWAAQSAGLITPGATAADIAALQAGLADLQSSVDDLSRQISALSAQMQAMLTQLKYDTLATPANALAAQVDGVANNLAYLAEICAPVPEGGAPPSPDVVQFCNQYKPSVVSQLNAHSLDYETLLTYVMDDPSKKKVGMIHLFSQSLGMSVRFFRPADSTTVINFATYWDTVLTQAATLKVELWHQYGAQNDPKSAVVLTDFLGNANANPATQGTFQNNHFALLIQTPPQLAFGTVINTKDRTMWMTDYPILPNASRTSCFAPPTSPGVWQYPQIDYMYLKLQHNWRSPSLEQAKNLIDGWSGASPMQWLINQTKAVAPESPESPGVLNILGPYFNNCPIVNTIWTSDGTGQWNNNHRIWFVVNLLDGTVSSPNAYQGAEGLSDNWDFLVRPIITGEYYYYYPEQ